MRVGFVRWRESSCIAPFDGLCGSCVGLVIFFQLVSSGRSIESEIRRDE